MVHFMRVMGQAESVFSNKLTMAAGVKGNKSVFNYASNGLL